MRDNRFAGLVLFGVFASGVIQSNIASAISSSENSGSNCISIENKSSNNCVEKKEFKENRDIPDKDILKNNKDEVPKTGSNGVKLSKGLASTSVVPLKGRSLVATKFEQRGKGNNFKEGNNGPEKNVIKNGNKETFLTGPGNVGFDKGLIYTGGSAAFLSLAGRLVKRYIDSKDENKSSQGEEVIYDNEDGKKGNKNKQEEQKNLWKVSFEYIGKSLLYIIIVTLVVLLVFFVCYFYLKNSLRKKLLSLKSEYVLDFPKLEEPFGNNIQIGGSVSGNVGAGLNILTNLNDNIIQTGKTGDNLFTNDIERIEPVQKKDVNSVKKSDLLNKQLSYEAKVDALLNNLGILGLFKFISGINQAGIRRLIILLKNLVDYNAEEVVGYKQVDKENIEKVTGKTDCFKSMLSAVKNYNKGKRYPKQEKDNVAAHFAILLNKITNEGALNFAKLLSKLYTKAKWYLSPSYCHAEKLGLLLSGLNNDGLTNFSALLDKLNANGIERFVKLIENSCFPPTALVYLLNKLVDSDLLIEDNGGKALDNFVKILNADCKDVVLGNFYGNKDDEVTHNKCTVTCSFTSNFIDFFEKIQCDGQHSNEPFKKIVELLKHLNNSGVSNFIRVFNRFVNKEFFCAIGLYGAWKFAKFFEKLNDKNIESLAGVLNSLSEYKKGAESFAILLNFLDSHRVYTLAEILTKLGTDGFVTLLETFEEEEDLKKPVNYREGEKPEPNLGIKKGGAAKFAEDLNKYSSDSLIKKVDELKEGDLSSNNFIDYIREQYGTIKQSIPQEISTNINFI